MSVSDRPGPNLASSQAASLERALTIALRMLGAEKLRELREGVGETVRVVFGGVACTAEFGPVAAAPAGGALFENPPPDDGELPPGVTGKLRAAYDAVVALWGVPGGRRDPVRPRHVKAQMEKAGGAESLWTVKKMLGQLCKAFCVLRRDKARGYVPNRAAGITPSPPPAG